MKLLRTMLCRHDYVFGRNVYGDEINLCGGARSLWRCCKCLKVQRRPDLHHPAAPAKPAA